MSRAYSSQSGGQVRAHHRAREFKHPLHAVTVLMLLHQPPKVLLLWRQFKSFHDLFFHFARVETSRAMQPRKLAACSRNDL
jgi:hypothetical protein